MGFFGLSPSGLLSTTLLMSMLIPVFFLGFAARKNSSTEEGGCLFTGLLGNNEPSPVLPLLLSAALRALNGGFHMLLLPAVGVVALDEVSDGNNPARFSDAIKFPARICWLKTGLAMPSLPVEKLGNASGWSFCAEKLPPALGT